MPGLKTHLYLFVSFPQQFVCLGVRNNWEKLNESFNWYNGSSVFNPKIGAMNVFFFFNFLEKKGREGEKYPFVVLLVYSFTGWFLYVLLLGI